MTKIVTRTDDVAGFFARAKDAARRADRGEAFEGQVTLSFEDPQRMFTLLSQARRRLMLEVMREPRTINELSQRLRRNRSTVTKDVGLLEKAARSAKIRACRRCNGVRDRCSSKWRTTRQNSTGQKLKQ